MGIVGTIKDVVELVQKADNVDLLKKILVLQQELTELMDRNQEHVTENRKLRELVQTQQTLRFVYPFYFRGEDPHALCAKCWEVDKLCVHLDGPRDSISGSAYDCPNCQTVTIHPRCERVSQDHSVEDQEFFR